MPAPDPPSDVPARRRSSRPAPPGWFDRFDGKLVLVLLDNKFKPSLSRGRSLWALYNTISYIAGEEREIITVPRGFPTDLASIPRLAWVLLPPDGPWVKAAIIHDFLYATAGTGRWGRWETRPPALTRNTPYSRLEADRILREAMENRGIGRLKRTIIYLAVRIGGGWAWKRARREREAAEAQATAAINDISSDDG